MKEMMREVFAAVLELLKDELTCSANHPLNYRETRPYRTENGYLTEPRFYEYSECATCPL